MTEITVEDYPQEAIEFQELIEAAILKWTAGAHATFRLLVGGRSGSVVLTVELTNIQNDTLQSGKYIIKGSRHSEWSDVKTEYEAHERAAAFNSDFAKDCIVGLKEKHDADSGYVILYEVAGQSLDFYGHTETSDSPQFKRICSHLVIKMLKAWTPKDPVDRTICELFKGWLGYRLEPDSNLRTVVNQQFSSTFSLVDNKTLVNPVHFIDFAAEQDSFKKKAFDALLHGDLHGGNIITHSTSPSSQDFILIDFALSRESFAGFDQAYLEMARVIYALRDRDPIVLVNALAHIDKPTETLVPEGCSELVDFLEQIRNAVSDWQTEFWPEWGDEVGRQFLLARIAAGLNWANKPWSECQADRNSKMLALYFAGWHAFKYQEQYADFGDLFRETHSSTVAVADATGPDPTSLAKINHEVSGFSDPEMRYILVSGGLKQYRQLEAMGTIPWSLVVDLDPESESEGLFGAAAAVLKQLRSVHIFSVNPEFQSDTDNGTVWNFSSGYPSEGEIQKDLGEWSLRALPALDNFLSQLAASSVGKKTVCLVLPGTSIDLESPSARTEEVCKLLWRKFGGNVKFLLFDPLDLGASYLNPTNVDVGTQAFIDMVASTLGAAPSQTVPTLPSQLSTTRDGDDLVIETTSEEIPFDHLRALEENFHVLHSRIQSNSTTSQQAFWRGNPPTWADLQTNADVPRDDRIELKNELAERLGTFQSHTIVLSHAPGTGATTLAYRMAWDFRAIRPVLILHTWSERIIQRLNSLYQTTKLPILIVADSSDLTDAEREDLYRQTRARNLSVIFLYVKRGFKGAKSHFRLRESMDESEANRFFEVYSKLVESSSPNYARMREYTRDKKLKRYRTPFYYGLAAFERDFAGVDGFVDSHLADLPGDRKDVLKSLALVTMYSRAYLNEQTLKAMLRMPEDSALNIEDALGDAMNIMSQSNSQFRIMHHLIAEEVFIKTTHAREKKWKSKLFLATQRFIDELSTCAGDTIGVATMLREMFAERTEGLEPMFDDDAPMTSRRNRFSQLISDIDSVDKGNGGVILQQLVERFPSNAHLYNHLGRYQMYQIDREPEKAIEYLEKAIQLSNGRDYIHFHTLGLTHRNMISIHKDQQFDSCAKYIETIEPHFENAVSAFEATRRMNSTNLHGYISEVEMILYVVQKLLWISGVDTIARLTGDAAEWTQEHFWRARALLDETGNYYLGLNEENDHLRRCEDKFNRHLGNLAEVVRIWETAVEKDPTNADSKRSLSHAYVRRSRKDKTVGSMATLYRIKALMEDNLRGAEVNDEDYRLWFDAYRRLPDFDVANALAYMRLWADQSNEQWRSSYYQFVIGFVDWFECKNENVDACRDALRNCQANYTGRRNQSYLYLTKEPTAFSVKSRDELSDWDREEYFFADTSPFQRVNGIVRKVLGPQAGRVSLYGNKFEAFFVPRETITSDNEGDPVSFFIGFSPTNGLRAYSVSLGTTGVSRRNRGQVEERLPATSVVSQLTLGTRQQNGWKGNDLETAQKFAFDLVDVKSERGAKTSLDDLSQRIHSVFMLELDERVLKQFFTSSDKYVLDDASEQTYVWRKRAPGLGRVATTRNDKKIGFVVNVHRNDQGYYGFVKLEGSGDYYFVANNVLEADREKLESGSVVLFATDREPQPDATDKRNRAGVAVDVSLASRDVLLDQALEYSRKLLQTAGGTIKVTDFKRRIESRFGFLVFQHLEMNHVKQLVASDPAIVVKGELPNEVFELGSDCIV